MANASQSVATRKPLKNCSGFSTKADMHAAPTFANAYEAPTIANPTDSPKVARTISATILSSPLFHFSLLLQPQCKGISNNASY
jgi:hypothetical protein